MLLPGWILSLCFCLVSGADPSGLFPRSSDLGGRLMQAQSGKSRINQRGFAEQHNSLLCSLGFVHCRIGILEKAVSHFSICRIYGNTDTDFYRKNRTIELAGLSNPTNHLLCKATHVGFLFNFPLLLEQTLHGAGRLTGLLGLYGPDAITVFYCRNVKQCNRQ